MQWSKSILLAPWLVIVGQVVSGAILPSNVLVLYNPAWSDGTHDGSYLADYYATQRGIPSGNVIGLNDLGTSEEISANDYLNVIWPQVQSALQTRNIDVIVTTKGLPLRIRNDLPNPAGPPDYTYTYTDPFDIERTIYDGFHDWKPYSSLESELTLINTIGVRNGSNWLNTALVQMGDQTYWDPNTPNPASNLYYQSTTSFSHSNPALGGMYLTARLDGFTVGDVTASIIKAKQAFLLPGNSSQFVVMDNDPNADISDRLMMQQLHNNVIDPSGQKHVYNEITPAVTTAPGSVIGYDSQGVHGRMGPEYINNQLQFQIAKGAVFNSHESYNAFTFDQATAAKIDLGEEVGPPDLPPEQWRVIPNQGLVAQWLGKGGTAGVGNVDEPQNGIGNEANEDQMFKMLLGGKTWAEAAWSSMQQLSYVNTVVGDPLMTWKKVLPGDANLDGKVTALDLGILSTHWLQTGQAGGAMWSLGDFNGDGKITALDLGILSTNWGKTASWASSPAVVSGLLNTEAFLNTVAIPEPPAISLIITSLISLLVGNGYYRLRRSAKFPPTDC